MNRSPKELLEAILNDEKILSREAPIEALGPELSEKAIKVLKSADVVTAGDFQDMRLPEIYALNCDAEIGGEIFEHWYAIQKEKA